jgi:hypothetical protein
MKDKTVVGGQEDDDILGRKPFTDTPVTLLLGTID